MFPVTPRSSFLKMHLWCLKILDDGEGESSLDHSRRDVKNHQFV